MAWAEFGVMKEFTVILRMLVDVTANIYLSLIDCE
jgi:hypothetical protein